MARQQPYGFVANLNALQTAGFDAQLPDRALRIFALLLSYADPNGECFPSQSKMAKKLGVSRQAVQKQVRELERKGYVKIFRQAKKTSIYRIVRKAEGCAPAQPHAVDTPATQYGCPKTPFKKTNKETKFASSERIWGRQRAYYQEKAREAETGISKTDEENLAAIREQAHQGLTLNERMIIDLDLKEEAEKLYALPKERHDFLHSRYTGICRERSARDLT